MGLVTRGRVLLVERKVHSFISEFLNICSSIFEVVVKYYKVVVLSHKVPQTVVFSQEPLELGRRSVICKFPRFNSFVNKHSLE